MRRRHLLVSSLPSPLLTGGLEGCRRARATSDGALRFGLVNALRNLDPRLATDATSERVNRLLSRALVELDHQGLAVPGVARWEVLSPTHDRFLLGDSGRDFSDGGLLRAGDVAATYGSILDPATASPHRALRPLIREIRVLVADQVEFLRREPDPLFPAYLGIGIVPAARAAGRTFAEEPLGSGPFRLLDRPEPGRLRLERRLDGQVLEVLTVKDPSVRLIQLLRGEIQVLQNDLSPERLRFLEGWGGVDAPQGGIGVQSRPGMNFSYLGFNLADPSTGQLAVREALAHAIDRESMVRYLFHGRARVAESLLPPQHWAAHPGFPARTYDPERA